MLRVYVLLISLFSIMACNKPPGDAKDLVARVESTYLTTSDFSNMPNHSLYTNEEATKTWLNDQVLRNHARNSTFMSEAEQGPGLQGAFERVEGEIFLDSLVRRYFQPTEGRLRAYYLANSSNYLFNDDAIDVILLSFIQHDDALNALKSLQSSVDFDSTLSLYNYDRLFVERQHLIPEISEVVFSDDIGRVVSPIISEFGYHLVFVEGRYSRGDAKPFDFVRRHIYERLLHTNLSEITNTIIDSLNEALNVEIYFD